MVTLAVTVVLTRLRYGNTLNYGISMFLEFGNVWQGVQK